MKLPKSTLLIPLLTLAHLATSDCLGLDAADNKPAATVIPIGQRFSGKIVFHQKAGTLTYEISVADGQITTGAQHFGDRSKPVAAIVGGWFDAANNRLTVLIQGTAVAEDKWRAQAQQFLVNPRKKTVTLEHALYHYGLDMTVSAPFAAHVLDSIEPANVAAK